MRALAPIHVRIPLVLPAGPANAHGAYESSVPAENEVVADSPETVDVYFGQELRRSGGLPEVFIVNEAGDTVSTESTLDDEDRTHVAVTLPPALPDGRYTVLWHTLSDQDGEEAQGAFHFYVGQGPSDGGETAPTTTPEAGNATRPPQATEPPSGDGKDDANDVPLWSLIAGIIAAAVVAGGAGLVLGRSSGG
jgi:methionine-rich copper-binding protein CopC